MDPPSLIHMSSAATPSPSSAPAPKALPEIWPLDSANFLGILARKPLFAQALGIPDPPGPALVHEAAPAAEESTVTNQSGSLGSGRKRRDALSAPAASEDETSKLACTSNGGHDLIDSNGKRLKVAGSRGGKGHAKELEVNSGNGNKAGEQNAQPSEAPKQDYIHVRARRGQATDSHSLAERARREKISERMKILQDLVPGCNKVIGKALVLDEIINYIQSLQHQVEFLSMKLEAVNSRMNTNMEGFPANDYGMQAFDATGMAFTSQATRECGQGSPTEWLHVQVGGGFERAT